MSDADPDAMPDEGKRLEFEDTVAIDTNKTDLWETISDPEVLTRCVPGAEEIERHSKTEYSVSISIGVSHLTISMSGDIEFVEMNEPDWIVTKGEAHDTKTGSDFDVLAAMEMNEVDDETTDLTYTAEVNYTGGVASLSQRLLRPIVNRKIDTYFANVKDEIEAANADE